MRAEEFITESRKNPKQNVKTPVRVILKNRFENTTDMVVGVPNLFASFTKEDKLGINPKLTVNYKGTPLGIYAYNAEYILDKVKDNDSMNKLPYAGDSPYINIFNIQGNIINLGTITKDQVDEYYQRIIENVSGEDKFNEIYGNLTSYGSSPINEEFWTLTRFMAIWMNEGKKTAYERQWNILFRRIGIDGVIDPGLGIIFDKSEEPNQAVFFTLKPIKNNERHLNKYQDKNIDDDFKNVKTVDDLIEFNKKYNLGRRLVDFIPRTTTEVVAKYFANQFGGTALTKLPRRFITKDLIANVEYQSIPDHFKELYPEINYLATSRNPLLIQFTPEKLITPEIAQMVVAHDKKMIGTIPEHAMTDQLVTTFIQQNGIPNNIVKNYLNTHPDLVLELLKFEPGVWRYLTTDLKNNNDIRNTAENGWLKTTSPSLIPTDLLTDRFIQKAIKHKAFDDNVIKRWLHR